MSAVFSWQRSHEETMSGAKRDRDRSRVGTDTNSTDPKLMNARVFMGNFPAENMGRQEVEELFKDYGKILGISLHKTYGFVQYETEEEAKAAVNAWNGKKLKGQVLDVNIATARRKEQPPETRHDRGHPSERRRRDPYQDGWERRHHDKRFGPRRSPSPGRFEHEMRLRHMEMERMRMGPRFRGPPIDPYFDDYAMRDPYMRPRDDPYDRFPPEPPFSRDLPSRAFPREPPMRPREPPPDWDIMGAREERRPLPHGPPPQEFRQEAESDKPLDMQIIVVNKLQKEYAEHVRGRFLRLGLRITVLQLSPTMSLADSLDEAAESGLLYVIIISNQNELHTSVTLTILHGRNPQEHKNMPLDDALGLVDRDFERYCIDVREGHVPARTTRNQKPDVPSLLSKMASGEQLRPEQLDLVINQLQRQKEASNTEMRAPLGMSRRPEAPSASKESIESQQADLQAKILSLLGSSAVVPTATATQGRPSQRTSMGEYSRPPAADYPSRPGAGNRLSGFAPW